MQSLLVIGKCSQVDCLGKPVEMTHKATHPMDGYHYDNVDMVVPRVSSVSHAATPTPCTTPGTSRSPVTVVGPPPTDGMMDANHGSVFETVGYSGILLMMLGTVVVYMSKKQAIAT